MISFRPAVRENVSLLVGLSGASGSGKTYTAMRLARGIAGDKPFAVIDTEAGRAKHYADTFRFDHGDLAPPFRPDAYADAIAAADAAGYPVIVVDSMSHEWAGQGGCLEWQEEEFERLGGKDSIKLLSWSKPKQSHKRMVQRLLQVRAHLIICLRAEEKVDIERVDGKTKIVPKEGPGGFKGWIPICERNLPYELTTSFLLRAENPGVPVPMKLQAQHAALFPLDKPITEDSGRAIAEWAAGIKPEPITAEQVQQLKTEILASGASLERLLEKAGSPSLEALPAAKFPAALAWIARNRLTSGDVEASTLLKIEKAKDRDTAAEVLDALDRRSPLYQKASATFVERWGAQ